MLVTEEILVDRSPVGRLAQLRASVSTGRAELRELEARRKQREEVLAEVASIESEASKLRAQAQAMAKRADAEEESIKTAPKQRWTDPAQSGAPDAEKLAEAAAHGKSLRGWSLQAGSGRISSPAGALRSASG
jgi:septal ring factor EnvC (AmiA/AmiB activator)